MMENQAGYYQGFDLLSCLRSAEIRDAIIQVDCF